MKDTAMGKTIIKDLQFIDEQLDLVISILEFEESEKCLTLSTEFLILL